LDDIYWFLSGCGKCCGEKCLGCWGCFCWCGVGWFLGGVMRKLSKVFCV
jgi:hypothetical protein